MSPDRVERLVQARNAYPDGPDDHYDEVLVDVERAVQQVGSIGKCDIGALMLWKRLNLSTTWTRDLNDMPDDGVREITSAAIESARDDKRSIPATAREARKALLRLPGCQTKDCHAVASAILTAGAPERMAVFDSRALHALDLLHRPDPHGDYGQYMDTVCALADEVNDARDLHWFPRDVEQALYVLGGQSDSAP